jgi:PKD repeat protein
MTSRASETVLGQAALERKLMRIARALVGVGAVTALLVGAPVPVSVATSSSASAAAATAVSLAPGVTAYYEMNEPAGTTVMNDSGPNGLDGVVDPTGVSSGVEFDGATGYDWAHRDPVAPPPSPERVIQVPDNPNLDPGNGPYTIELRYRTQEKFGNITQKGQSTTPGGQWKIQAPGGQPSCLFKGSAGQVATQVTAPLNDEQWHDLTCVLTSTGVSAYVDGVFNSRKNGTAGTIDNTFPMTIGGKISCNQITVTCDYFSGQIDFIKITKAANLSPTAAYTSSCFGLSCSFDSSASADADGSLTKYAWDFGDGQTSTEVNPSHTYAAPGSYTVRLTVTDNQAVTDREDRSLTVEDTGPIESPIEYVASVTSAANTSSPTVTVPAAATPGDRLLMVLSYNNLTRTVSPPTSVTGWTQLDSLTAGTMGTVAWTKVVEPGDPGRGVTVPLSGSAKYTLTLADYTGTEATPSVDFADATFVASTSSRRTPTVTASAGDWVVSYWADKSSTTTAWTPSDSVTTRRTACGADGGRICSALADSGAALPPGPYGNIEATTNAPSDQATMWSFVLGPSTSGPPPNQPPTADFGFTCTLLDCEFDSSDSVDPDGTITSYAWDFGDGTAATEANPSHSFPASGTYDVELTVTDDDGDSDAVTATVEVQGTPVESQIDYVGSAAVQASNSTPRVTVPAAAAVGDRLVLALSLNNTTRTVSAPTGVTGWTQLDSVVADDMRTVMWTKVVQAGDPGTQVTVALDGTAKYTLTVAAYTGVDSTQGLTFAAAADTADHANRVTPAVTVPEGAWVVSYWADKSSTTTVWTAAGSVTGRQMLCGADSGRICSLFADSGGAVPPGLFPGATATTDAPSRKATTWSIVLAPGA